MTWTTHNAWFFSLGWSFRVWLFFWTWGLFIGAWFSSVDQFFIIGCFFNLKVRGTIWISLLIDWFFTEVWWFSTTFRIWFFIFNWFFASLVDTFFSKNWFSIFDGLPFINFWSFAITFCNDTFRFNLLTFFMIMVIRVVEFSSRGLISTKLERFLPRNQSTQRKLFNFENWWAVKNWASF